jgi:hypothetical protein
MLSKSGSTLVFDSALQELRNKNDDKTTIEMSDNRKEKYLEERMLKAIFSNLKSSIIS